MRVLVFGAGKVGRTLAATLRRSPKYHVTLAAARGGVPERCRAEMVILCVRDGQLRSAAEALAEAPWVGGVRVVLHVSGAVSPEVLSALRGCGGARPIQVGQLHPMLSFASARRPPSLVGGHALVAGDASAVRAASAVARAVGLTPRRLEGVDLHLYHAAAVMVAGGAAALVSAGTALLELGGIPRALAPKVLGPLLASVAANITSLGLPEALTGPVRRGARAVVAHHIAAIRHAKPPLLPLYRALGEEQLALAFALKDAPPAELEAVAALLRALPSGAGPLNARGAGVPPRARVRRAKPPPPVAAPVAEAPGASSAHFAEAPREARAQAAASAMKPASKQRAQRAAAGGVARRGAKP